MINDKQSLTDNISITLNKPEHNPNRYRKRPVIIEAFQMTKERRWDNSEWPAWMHAAWQGMPNDRGSIWSNPTSLDPEKLMCGTLEGPHVISWDDWIIQGVKGEIYPCKPDIFEMTYDKEI